MSRLQANLTLLLAAMIWGSTFVVQKIAFMGEDGGGADADAAVGPFAFTGARFVLGAMVVLPWALRENRRAARPLDRWDALGFVLCGCALFAGSVTQQIGIIHTSVTNAGFLTGLYVPMVPVLALLLFRHWPHWAVWPAAVGCVAGTYLLNGGTLTRFAVGDLWVLGGAVFWALHVTLVGIFVTRCQRPLALACIQFLAAGIAGVTAGMAAEQPSLAAFASVGFEVLWAGVMSVGIAFTLQVIGQRHTHPAAAAIILSSEMLFAALSGAIFLGERLGPAQLGGGLLILACIIAVELAPFLRRARHAVAE